jgi:tetratricopeptide (TPR) repeat protein
MACILLARVLRTAGGSERALPLLDEARLRFEAVAQERPGAGAERMVSACFTEQGECLLDLGRLNEAAAACEEAIRRDEQRGADRDVAIGKGQLGTVRMQQRRHPEALAAYEEARARFTQLDEPGTVAMFWHQTGMVYQDAGQPEAAEDAYRKSLAIVVRLGDVDGQARTLGELGNLYGNVLDRPEEAAAFYRQAADKYVAIRDVVNEGRARSNLGDTLRQLRRLDEARQEIRRAIECKTQFGHAASPWTSWSVLAAIETDAGNPTAAAEAKRKAIACYLAYRRDGGENHDAVGRICLAVTQSLLAGDAAVAASLLQQLAAHPNASGSLGTFIRAMQAIVAGSRDRTLADAAELDYSMAAEILFLIETLEKV